MKSMRIANVLFPQRKQSTPEKTGLNDISSWGLQLVYVLSQWRCRVKTRAQLARLQSHQLKDIGLTEAEVHEELAKPFWR